MKKPDIFKPNIGYINNNKKAYYSFLEEESKVEEERRINSFTDVNSFLSNLSKRGEYVFNKRVVIETNNKRYDTKIAGKMGNNIITLDGDTININDIIKIYEK